MAVSKAKDEPDIIDDDDVEEMRAELERSAAEVEKLRKAYISERDQSARLREQLRSGGENRNTGGRNDDYGEEHVIDLWGRSCEAWRYPNFRLFVFMVAAFGNAAYGAKFVRLLATLPHCGYAASHGQAALNTLCIALFLLWSLGQFRKRGLAQVFLKWAVFFAALALSELVRGELVSELDRDWRVIAVELVLVMVLTFTKISEWLGRQIRVHIWQTRPVAIVKGWF
jgi:hypothetical protein